MTTTENIATWSDHERIVFQDTHFDQIDLFDAKKPSADNSNDFNTELVFRNCTIGSFQAATLLLGKHVTFENCSIGFLSCFATYFFGGLRIENCVVKEESSFDSGVHNLDPHAFEIIGSTFEGFVEFFDVLFLGPVNISRNQFKAGTNLLRYLKVPYGIAEGIPCVTEGNVGEMEIRRGHDIA